MEGRYDNIDTPDALAEKAAKGDKEAFEKLYLFYFTPIFRYILSRVKRREDAEDITQQIFLKIFRLTSGRGLTLSRAYVFSAARNAITDHWRKPKEESRNDMELEAGMPSDAGKDPEEAATQMEHADIIRDAIGRLTPDRQEVISLKFIAGLSTKEIAQMLGKNEDAVRQSQSRALKALKNELDKSKYEQ